jgi:hypothetical protein
MRSFTALASLVLLASSALADEAKCSGLLSAIFETVDSKVKIESATLVLATP